MKLYVLGALILIQVLFGINYVVSKVIVNYFNPIIWACLRLAVASTIMAGLCKILRRKHPPFEWAFFFPMFIFSLLGVVINQACFLLGIRYTSATNSAILNTLIPILTLFIVALKGQERLGVKRIVGFFLSMLGVLVLRRVEDISLSDETLKGDLFTIIACVSCAFFLGFSKKFFEKYDQFWTTTWLFAFGTIGLLIISATQWTRFQWPQMTPSLGACLVFNIIGGTIIVYFLNIWALSRVKSSSVALFIYLQPVVASALAWKFLGEELTVRTVFSSVAIFSGLLMTLMHVPGVSEDEENLEKAS